MVFPPFDPTPPTSRHRRRFRPIPVRVLLPNLITLLALCAGLTAMRMAVEGNMQLALAAIVFAALLDGIDGRIARMLKGTSRFGAELDSLADFVNFGVAPALILYFWGLQELKSAGWIAALVFAICAALRLARFNVMIDEPNQPIWAGNFFTGIPAPAGAISVLLPIYLNLLGAPTGLVVVWLTFLYTLAIALLMVSRLPVFSGKRVGKRVPPEMVLPVFVVVVLFFALLISYPWQVLSIGTLAYLACLPLGWLSYRNYQRKDAQAAAAAMRRGASRRSAARTTPVRPARHVRRGRPPGTPELMRATRVLKPAERGGRKVADTVILDYAQRSAGAATATGLKGGRFEIALAQPTRLRTDDALLLEDGSLLEVVAAPEPLVEARAADVAGLARLAWHLGDRHIPVQMLPNRIRARREPDIEDLLASLGAKVTVIEAPFEPEGGAYEFTRARS